MYLWITEQFAEVKGLEYKCCFIVGLEEGLFPSHMDENEEEERRRNNLLTCALCKCRRRRIFHKALHFVDSIAPLLPSRSCRTQISKYLPCAEFPVLGVKVFNLRLAPITVVWGRVSGESLITPWQVCLSKQTKPLLSGTCRENTACRDVSRS